MILIDASGVAASRPGKPLFSDLSVVVESGDRLGVVGLNGCGKSTLLHVLAGTGETDAGTVRRGRGTRITMLDQGASLPPGTVAQAVGPDWQAEAILERLGMGGTGDRQVDSLSGGQAKRVALARALVAVGGIDGQPDESDLLILDEPTNHLDIDAIAWLEEWLARFPGGLILVTHDRHVLDRVTTKVLELDRGTGYVHLGGYQSWLEARAEREERAADAETKRRNLARTELAWLRRGAPARTRKPKARMEAAKELIATRPDAPARSGDLPLHFGTPRLGDNVLELVGVTDGYDDRTLFDGVDLLLGPGDRLGIVGPNGAGKSTLLDVLAGRRTPRAGERKVGVTVQLGYYDQIGVELDLSLRVRDAIAGPNRQPDWADDRLLEAFWFDDDARWAPIGLLSGGERRRVQLLLTLAAKPNVLLLDEPTNDLDLDTLRALEDFLEDWPGTLVVVSHDRAFLERTVDDVLAVEAGRAAPVPGGVAGWQAQQAAKTRRVGQVASVGGTGTPRTTVAPTGAAPAAGPGAKGAAKKGDSRADKGYGTSSGRAPNTLRRLLREAEKDLARLSAQRDKLEAEMAANATDHVKLTELGAKLTALAAQVEAAEEAWMALGTELEDAGLS